jgi:hypothetical protein
VLLSLANASGDSPSEIEGGAAALGVSPALQYYTSVSGWVTYNASTPPTILSGTTLLVRVAISGEQETALDGPETFNLVATNTGGTSTPNTQGVATIRDDGQGIIYLGNNNTANPNQPGDTDSDGPDYPAQLDDDRVLTVSNVNVNEGSPYAVFTVTGATGQTVLLSLANASGSGSPDAAGGAAALGATPALQYLEGGVWKNYDANNPPQIASGATTLLVRVAINAEQETALDGPETFNLVATNTGGTSTPNTQGVGTIRDDGQGDYFAADNTSGTSNVPAGVRLDDDRTVTVNSFNINEGSPYAVFTVSATGGAAQAGQLVTLSLANGTTTGMSGLQYYDATASEWVTYNGGTVALDAAGQLLVRTSMKHQSAQSENEVHIFWPLRM